MPARSLRALVRVRRVAPNSRASPYLLLVDAGLLAGYPEASAFWEAHPELAEPPQPRPDASRPMRVAVVTLCDSAMEPLCAASIDNKRAYAERHGAREA